MLAIPHTRILTSQGPVTKILALNIMSVATGTAFSACVCWLPWKLYDCHVMYRRREISSMDALQAALQVKTLDQLAELEERVSRCVCVCERGKGGGGET